MQRRTKYVIAGAAVAAGLVAGAGIAVAATELGEDDDRPLEGATLERAVAAALAHTGGGTVTETEVGDDGAAFSVEVRLADGRQVEVGLDEAFAVVHEEPDDDGPLDDDDRDDD